MKPTALDRFIVRIAPRWGMNRLRARSVVAMLERNFEAAHATRRTSGWNRGFSDPNAANGPALTMLRSTARDLVRNNGWAKNALRAIGRNTVGWGIIPKPTNAGSQLTLKRARDLWRQWGETCQCDFDGRHNFYGLQRVAMEAIAESGDVIIRRRRRPVSDGLAIPLQLQVLESDYLDLTRDGQLVETGGRIIQGVEFDKLGRRVAYWLYREHPGANAVLKGNMFRSDRVPAEDVIHVYRMDRPGQIRGVSWYASAIVRLKDFDEYDDATLMRQKIAACFAAFVTDVDGTGATIGIPDSVDENAESFEPGLISYLPPGKQVTFGNPPTVNEHESYSSTNLHAIAAALGVTYEDLTGDYSQVNFASSRMARIAHWGNVHDWRWNILIPQMCDGVWAWAMDAALIAGTLRETPAADWTPPPMPMLEPDKEGLAYMRMVRTGMMTHDQMVREQGGDPDTHWEAYAEGLKKLDALGIVLDSDPRKTTQAGNPTDPTGSEGDGSGDGADPKPPKPKAKD